jgi:site-specific DNA-methyltransferase (adenine-specific)
MLLASGQRRTRLPAPRLAADRNAMVEQLRFDAPGRLFFGDNLEVLRRHIASESVDLVYLDPPFNSNRSYNVLFQHRSGKLPAAQVRAFDDTWRWDMAAAETYHEVLEAGGELATALEAMRSILGTTDMLAYLTMMGPRLVELRRVLKPTGSLYLHCDQNASHYLKLLLDAVFGPTSFRNEIIWKRTFTHGNVGRNFGAIVQSLFFYTVSNQYTWNQPFTSMDEDYVKKRFSGADSDGRKWQSVTLRNPSPRPNLRYDFTASNGVTYKPHPNGWAVGPDRMQRYDDEGRLHFPAKPTGQLRMKQYLDETRGVKASNLWVDIYPINSQAAERLRYPTQKPVALLQRIIATSTNQGDVVLDPFCGCGTTVDAAQALGRQWIGIDITAVAIDVIRERLAANYPNLHYDITGEPASIDEAEALATLDKHEFERWVMRRFGVDRPVKKGADRGIDGELTGPRGDGSRWRAIVSVKGGATNVTHIRDLRGTVAREKADLGLLVTLRKPTSAMRREAADGGFTKLGQPRLQILTVEDLLAGHQPELPPSTPESLATKRRLRAI